MGGKSSKLGPDDDTRLDKLRKRRLTASKGCSGSVNVIPTNVQDSPYLQRATNGACPSPLCVYAFPRFAYVVLPARLVAALE